MCIGTFYFVLRCYKEFNKIVTHWKINIWQVYHEYFLLTIPAVFKSLCIGIQGSTK